ncbi:MFS transporter [Streptomyces sp. Y2F8-2]|uniref:DHA2 family efflux MFS transporter permease subunit n=1 Tax=Streptomyces sp. Y2F8-2 TaxID=2759675 RepID=UPI001905E406|nr:DHA2 family efflux MFS transporter permease subunit [Streptomyces sp. Y2F8-2]GHJ98965.1 MFS transporter [Streptomyces sp. Y2F8-2]
MNTKLRGNPWAMLTVLSLGYFMTMLDMTIINVAVPSISGDLHASLADIAWMINGYVIAVAAFLITAGRLGDLWGPRNLFLGGVVLFTVSSMACGLAQNTEQLIAGRFVQGLGAALLLPQTMTFIIAVFPAERRGSALGVWGAIAGVATVAGPTLGGLLITVADWRWVFYINLPIGVAVLVLGPLLLTDVRPGRRASLDPLGVLLLTVGLVLLTYGLAEGQRYDWGTVDGWITIPGVLAAGAVVLLLFLLDQRRKQGRSPLVPFELFKDRNYTLMNGVNVLVSLCTVGVFLPLNIYLQSVLGYNALKTGLTMAPIAVVSVAVAPVAGRLVDRVGGKYILVAGLVLFIAGIGSVAFIAEVETPWYAFLPGFAVAGAGVGCTFGPMQTLATYDVPHRLAGAASGVLNSNRQFGSVLGGLVAVAVLQNRLLADVTPRAADAARALPAPLRGRFVDEMTGAAAGAAAGGGRSAPALAREASPELARKITDLASTVLSHSLVAALVPALLVVCGAMALGVLLAAAARQPAPSAAADQSQATAPTAVPALPPTD